MANPGSMRPPQLCGRHDQPGRAAELGRPDPTSLGLDMPTHAPHPENEPSDMGQNQNRGRPIALFWGLSDRVLAMGASMKPSA